ncbi:MAG: helix-turn-helix domain-containing protein [Propionibacteriaceae bacterium]|jgi:transcriptional regulator with XRE-family HTH domain|nr:helix-turn-helix domain-containing protein [Propionibacteriaceae bacterium]
MTGLSSDWLRRARLSRQLTMAALADLARVPTSTVSRIESGRIEPTVAMLARLLGAAGFRFEPTLAESGGDQPLADVLERLESAAAAERARWLNRLPAVASVAPVARRTGARRVAVPGDLATAIGRLRDQGQNPIVSGVEAWLESIDPVRSFIPLVCVDDPARAEGFGAAGRGARQVMLLLATTANVRRWTRTDTPVPMTARLWGLLDAMASPGRQGDIARELFKRSGGAATTAVEAWLAAFKPALSDLTV